MEFDPATNSKKQRQYPFMPNAAWSERISTDYFLVATPIGLLRFDRDQKELKKGDLSALSFAMDCHIYTLSN